MKTRKIKHQEESVSEQEFFASFHERARDLHDALVNYGVPARDIPKSIMDLRDLYRTVIFHDQLTFKPKRFTEPYDEDNEPSIVMARILNKFVHYHLTEQDITDLKSLNFVEASHVQDYFRFEEEVKAYARFVRSYMIKLNQEIDSKSPQVAEIAAYYGDGRPPNGVQKLQKILHNVEYNHFPISLIKQFEKVFALFESIKPSKHRPAKAQEFYDAKLSELHTFCFIPEVSQQDQAKMRVTMSHAVKDL